MKPTATLTHIRDAFDFLQEQELLYWAQLPVEREGRISWPSGQEASFLGDRGEATVGQYLSWLQARQYACLLLDGSMLQITYDFDGQSLVGHRLAYIPCPIELDDELIGGDVGLPELVELEIETAPRERFLQRSPIRFDYDPASAGKAHPASHMTVNSCECRIFCVAPVHPYSFISFVYRNFYPALHDAQPGWFSLAAGKRIRTFRAFEPPPGHIHISWSKR